MRISRALNLAVLILYPLFFRECDGIGVESILSVCAKYGGVVDFSALDGAFVCQMLLSNKMT